jgi:hypothetical protein
METSSPDLVTLDVFPACDRPSSEGDLVAAFRAGSSLAAESTARSSASAETATRGVPAVIPAQAASSTIQASNSRENLGGAST